jgi:hypothetical protein
LDRRELTDALYHGEGLRGRRRVHRGPRTGAMVFVSRSRVTVADDQLRDGKVSQITSYFMLPADQEGFNVIRHLA